MGQAVVAPLQGDRTAPGGQQVVKRQELLTHEPQVLISGSVSSRPRMVSNLS